jgi:hypothetical protein
MGNTLVDADARSNTRQELLKRAEELGVVGRWRMNKADLADAIARKEATQAAAEQELQSVEEQVRERVWRVAQQEYRDAAQEVRRELHRQLYDTRTSSFSNVRLPAGGNPTSSQVRLE